MADRHRLVEPLDDDQFTAWLLKWQHWILPCLALAFVASFLR